MKTIIISEDDNKITIGDEIHNFNPGSESTCEDCTMFTKCCELQETVENEFPFPCVAMNRTDGLSGNFILE